MADEIDMWEHIKFLGEINRISEETDLLNCYEAKYINGDLKKANELKEEFERKYGYWNNWY